MRLHEISRSKKTIYFMMAFSNPPTFGYSLAFNKLKALAGTAEHIVFLNPLSDVKLNPLSFKTSLAFNKKIFPNIRFSEAENIKTPLEALKYLSNEYDVVTLVTRDENVTAFKRFGQYADAWGIREFRVLGLGDSSSDATKGKTNTLSRKFVIDNDFDSFKKTIPSEDPELVSKLFLELRKAMLLNVGGKRKQKDTIEECVDSVIEYVERLSGTFNISEEFLVKDKEGNMIFLLEKITDKFKNIRLVLSNKYKEYSIGRDNSNNMVIFINTSADKLDKKLVEDKEIVSKTIKNAIVLSENTSGSMASVNAVLGSPIKRITPSDNTSYEFVKTIKYDKSCNDKLSTSMSEFVNRYGYIDSDAINKIKSILGN